MRKHILIVMTAILVLALAIAAMAADPFVGTWKFDSAKSKFSTNPAPKSHTLKIDAQGDGYKMVNDRVDADGKAGHEESILHLDGKDYPIPDNQGATYLSRRIDNSTFIFIVKRDGKEIVSRRYEVSQDGRTLIWTFKGKSNGKEGTNIHVFDKQ